MYTKFKFQRLLQIDSVYTFFKADYKNDYVFDGERHNFWEMVFVLEGNVGVTADSDIYILEKGQAVIHRPNEFHKIWSEFATNPSVIILSFDATILPEINGRIFSVSAPLLKKITELYDSSFSIFNRDTLKLMDIKSGKKAQAQDFWLQMERCLLSCLTRKAEGNDVGLKSAEIYSNAVRIMEENIAADYCVEDIAKQCSVSSAYIKKIFVKYAGIGVIHYYNRLRAQTACRLLSEGKSVKEAASLVGFEDQNYFSTFFKRVTGQRPSEYRRKKLS